LQYELQFQMCGSSIECLPQKMFFFIRQNLLFFFFCPGKGRKAAIDENFNDVMS
jgi:hypothetical protein